MVSANALLALRGEPSRVGESAAPRKESVEVT